MKSFEIGSYSSELKDELIEYNQMCYGRSDTEKYFTYRFVNHPYIDHADGVAALAFSEGKIVGQQLYVPLKFSYRGKTESGVWGMDLMLNEECRGQGVGKKLVEANEKVSNYFSFSVSKHAKDLHEKFGFSVIDSFIRLVYVPSIFEFIRLYFKPKKDHKIRFPSLLETKEFSFEKMKAAPDLNKTVWNDNIVEFLRDKDFLKWRFFGDYDQFHLYLNMDAKNPFYFVVKTLSWRGHKFLCIVDMRVDKNEKMAILSIINACKLLMRSSGLKGIIAGSTLKDYIRCFNDCGFFEFEYPTIILTNASFAKNYPKFKNERINVNMADSDFENVYELKGNLRRKILKGYILNAI